MRRILSSYLQSYSPFLGPVGDVPPLAHPVLDDHTSVGVQTVPGEFAPTISTPLGSVTAPPLPPPPPESEADDTVVEERVSTSTATATSEPSEDEGTVDDSDPTELAAQNDADSTATQGTPEVAESLPKDTAPAPDLPAAPELEDKTPADVPSSDDPQTPQRDEELWFEDGNLVLVAGNVEFRVYKGPFMAQSAFFKDMLSLPQPASTCSMPHNAGSTSCAIVHLTDSPEDVRHFLRVFVEGALKFEPTFDEISAYIRLGHKYQCEKMVQRSLDYLRKYYVDDFDLWFKVTSLDPPTFKSIHRVGVVNLARLAGADYLLPVALMCCCMLGPEISEGFTREDGTKEMLSMEDLTLCFVGRARLLEATFVAAHRTFRQPVADGCRNPSRCKEALQRLLHEMVESPTLMKDIRDLRIDNSKSDYINETDEERALCSKCFVMIGKQGRQTEQHREVFKNLPELMGVTVQKWSVGGDVNGDGTTTTD